MKPHRGLAVAFLTAHPSEASRILAHADAEPAAALLGAGSDATIAANLRRMAPDEGAALLARLPVARVRGLFAELPLGSATQMLRAADETERDRLLGAIPEDVARALRTALDHPEDTAGSLMASDMLALPSHLSAGEARRYLHRRAKRLGNYLYVVDDHRKLLGAVGIGSLMIAHPNATLTALMQPAVQSIATRAKTAQILAHPGWRELHALPVVDTSGHLVGILRRETYERLRESAAGQVDPTAGVGMALVEMTWVGLLGALTAVAGTVVPEARDDD